LGQLRGHFLVRTAALGAAFIILAAVQLWLAPGQGWWNDEMFSLWASDPAAGLLTHVASDSNPPLYFIVLQLVRTLFADPRTAVMIASALMLLATSAFTFSISRTQEWRTWAAIAIAAFVVNGVVAFMFQEARAFLLGACIVFAAAWQCMLVVNDEGTPPRPIALAVLGVLAAMTHFYAALALGSLAGGLVVWSLLGKRRDLLVPGLILGGVAVLTFGAWYAYASARVANIAWIDFSPNAVRAALWYVRSLEIGPNWMALPLVAIFGFAAWKAPALRPSLIVLAIAGVLFFALPVLISLKTPIIMGRYWTVGAAFVPIALVLIARAFWSNPAQGKLVAGAAGAFVLASAVFGAAGARLLMQVEPVWSGASLVAELAASCAPGSVRVPDQPHLYAAASGLAENVFVPFAQTSTPTDCPVLGWAEHVLRGDGYSLNAPEAELLELIGVTAPAEGVTIARHPSGYVILRAEAQ
jgi:hypothetical protein